MHPRPDLRLRENRLLIPNPPEELTAYQIRKWREEQLSALRAPQPRQPAPPTPSVNGPRARARAAGSSFLRGGLFSPFSPRTWLRMLPGVGRGLMGLTMLTTILLLAGQHGPLFHVARVFGATADVGEATSAVTVHALNLTNQVATAATTLVAVATTNGLSAGANLWKGVDLGSIHARRCGGSVIVTSPLILQRWLIRFRPSPLPLFDRGPQKQVGDGGLGCHSRLASHSSGD